MRKESSPAMKLTAKPSSKFPRNKGSTRIRESLLRLPDSAAQARIFCSGTNSIWFREKHPGSLGPDTTGRLHTKHDLPAELTEMCRIASREVTGAPHQILLVIDATTSQNGLAQARQFTEKVRGTNVVLTKFDGTTKGASLFPSPTRWALPSDSRAWESRWRL